MRYAFGAGGADKIRFRRPKGGEHCQTQGEGQGKDESDAFFHVHASAFIDMVQVAGRSVTVLTFFTGIVNQSHQPYITQKYYFFFCYGRAKKHNGMTLWYEMSVYVNTNLKH